MARVWSRTASSHVYKWSHVVSCRLIPQRDAGLQHQGPGKACGEHGEHGNVSPCVPSGRAGPLRPAEQRPSGARETRRNNGAPTARERRWARSASPAFTDRQPSARRLADLASSDTECRVLPNACHRPPLPDCNILDDPSREPLPLREPGHGAAATKPWEEAPVDSGRSRYRAEGMHTAQRDPHWGEASALEQSCRPPRPPSAVALRGRLRASSAQGGHRTSRALPSMLFMYMRQNGRRGPLYLDRCAVGLPEGGQPTRST